MNRREFVLSLPALGLSGSAASGTKITRITVAQIQGRFHKFVAMNSYDTAPKGHTYENLLVRIHTDRGVEGVGVMLGAANADFQAGIRTLLGVDPMSLYEMKDGRIVGRMPAHSALLTKYFHVDGPLFDLIGKLTGKPCWQLIGEAVRDHVEVYDATLYFADVWFEDRGIRAVVEESEEAVRKGYIGLKFKVGRGWKWMEKEAGLKRDIEVLKVVRKAIGPAPKILADANNGYRDDFEGAWRFLEGTADVGLYWIEELFPEDVGAYERLREHMTKAGMKTLIADGENVGEPAAFLPYLKPKRLMDMLQMDIRRGGVLANIEVARMGAGAGALCVPHNWASQVGMFMGLHLAKAISNITAAEDDRSTFDTIVAEGYEFRNGHYSVPESPGLGIRVNEEVYRKKYGAGEIVIA
jgi:L-alanine-DL-glutamate epimerase-like enolase superfamily enzyme